MQRLSADFTRRQIVNLDQFYLLQIENLRTWASGHGLAKTYSKFKNIAAGCYFDIICQVDIFYILKLFINIAIYLISYLASSYFIHLLITFANSLNPDQDRQNVGPDLDPNHLMLLMLFLKEFLEKVNFEKS